MVLPEDSPDPNSVGTTCECPGGGNDSGYLPEPLPSAPVNPLPPEVRGGLDRAAVRRVVRRHIRELLACYPASARDRIVGGMLMVDFTIAPSGEVRAASLRHQTLGDDQIAGCFVGAIRAWRFPRPRHGEETVVAQRFTLFPRRGRFPWRRSSTRDEKSQIRCEIISRSTRRLIALSVSAGSLHQKPFAFIARAAARNWSATASKSASV